MSNRLREEHHPTQAVPSQPSQPSLSSLPLGRGPTATGMEEERDLSEYDVTYMEAGEAFYQRRLELMHESNAREVELRGIRLGNHHDDDERKDNSTTGNTRGNDTPPFSASPVDGGLEGLAARMVILASDRTIRLKTHRCCFSTTDLEDWLQYAPRRYQYPTSQLLQRLLDDALLDCVQVVRGESKVTGNGAGTTTSTSSSSSSSSWMKDQGYSTENLYRVSSRVTYTTATATTAVEQDPFFVQMLLLNVVSWNIEDEEDGGKKDDGEGGEHSAGRTAKKGSNSGKLTQLFEKPLKLLKRSGSEKETAGGGNNNSSNGSSNSSGNDSGNGSSSNGSGNSNGSSSNGSNGNGNGNGSGSSVKFKLVVWSPSGRWHVWRRYSEFLTLHQALGNSFEQASLTLPPFPSKNVIGSYQRSKTFLENRRKKLDIYMSAVVNTHAFHTKALAHFLDPLLGEDDVVDLP